MNEMQLGRKQVVDFIAKHSTIEASYTGDDHLLRSWIEIPTASWQAQLREWGLKEDYDRENSNS